jgi:glycogen(starch) synthase
VTSTQLQPVGSWPEASGRLTRVLVWSDLFWPYIGGPEVLMAKVIPALRDRGFEFLVVTSHDYLPLPDEACYDGIDIVRLPFRAAVDARDLTALREVTRQAAAVKRAFAPDLIHAVSVAPSLFFHLRTLAAHPAPWLIGLRQEVLPSQSAGDGTLFRQAMRSASWVAACADAVLAQARVVAPEIASRSSVIRSGLDLAVPPSARSPAHPQRLLCLGRLVPAKGFDVAITAFAALVARFPNLRLTIAGDGPERAELERQAARLGLENGVEFLGWVDPARVPELLGTATVVVMPSRREGLPLAAVEAAWLARPIVASRVSGLPEVISHGETGLLVDYDDPHGVAEAIAFLLEHPDDAARMGRAARRRARSTLSFDRCVDEYDALYRALIRRYACSR